MTHHLISCREAMLAALFGVSGIGLRALASGLPASFIANPLAPVADKAASSAAQAQVVACNGSGDPLGNNAPGTYAFAQAVHPGAAATQAKSFSMGGSTVTGAAAWSALPQAMLDRLAFIHHSTYTSVHTDYPQVLTLMGQVANRDSLLSQCALALGPQLKSTQMAPLALGDSSQTFQGASLPYLPPSSLSLVFRALQSPLLNLQKLRNETVDELHAGGNAAQRAYMDNLAQSRTDAHALGATLAGDLAKITDNGVGSQLLAAAAMLRMNVTPVIAVNVDFGGDNHSDPDLSGEAGALPAMVNNLATFYAQLQSYGISDKVTLACFNVFGRTFAQLGTAGRKHWGNHCCALVMGSAVKGGVYGGIMPFYGEFQATGIDSSTGAAAGTGGDIPYEQLLASTGKTFAAAAGIDATTVNQVITSGKVISGALG